MTDAKAILLRMAAEREAEAADLRAVKQAAARVEEMKRSRAR